ncbi:MAG: hypothetical protein H6Q22_1244, partial [Bacteroidetes bacterium]|nr:hypothetical protein [Bacteroidota bacterium]
TGMYIYALSINFPEIVSPSQLNGIHSNDSFCEQPVRIRNDIKKDITSLHSAFFIVDQMRYLFNKSQYKYMTKKNSLGGILI